MVINKPSGLLSVPGRGPEKRDSVITRVQELFTDTIEHPAVHRLDMDTSGLMVVARTAEAHRHLSIQFQDRMTSKRYVALLDGVLDGEDSEGGVIELPFRLDVENRPLQIYDDVHGKMGKTVWRRIAIEGGYTRVGFEPITGRTHQLRLHASHEKGIGIPIVGDPFYGAGTKPGEMKLHASELSFMHPDSGEMLTFHSKALF